ncbi:hypothetical protein [Rhodopila sp.]|uniref:hypothetical protein n=1 Tax=Rhodopila sp. TaxID=2480087 RepID=UPI003D102B73
MIDLEPIVREAGGRGLNGDARDAAAAFLCEWHGGGANEHGSDMECETVVLAKVRGCSARVMLMLNGRGHWLSGHDFEAQGFASTSGGPSVWAGYAFETRQEALQHELAAAAAWFDQIANETSSCASESLKCDARELTGVLSKMVEGGIAPANVAKPVAKAMQLDLF